MNKQEIFEQLMNDKRLNMEERAEIALKIFGEEDARELIKQRQSQAEQRLADHDAQVKARAEAYKRMPNKQEIFDRIMNNSQMGREEQAARLVKEFGEVGALEMIELNAAQAKQRSNEYNAQAEYYDEKAQQAEERVEAVIGKRFWNILKKALPK